MSLSCIRRTYHVHITDVEEGLLVHHVQVHDHDVQQVDAVSQTTEGDEAGPG